MENAPEYRPGPLRKRNLVAAASFLAFAVLFLGFWVLFTETGLRMMVGTLLNFAEENVHVSRISGRLAGTIHLEEADVRMEDFSLSIDGMDLRLDLPGLMFLALRIRDISASGVRIALPGSHGSGAQTTDRKGGGFGLLRKLIVSNLSIENLTLRQEDREDQLLADRVQFSGETDGRFLKVEKLFLARPEGELTLSGNMDLAQDLSVESELSWSIRLKEDRIIKGEGTIKGPFETLHIRQNVTEPFRGEVMGFMTFRGEEPFWEAEAMFRDLDPGWFLSRDNLGNLTGRINGRGTMKSFSFESDAIAFGMPGLGTHSADISLEAEGQSDLVRLKELKVSLRDSPLRIEAAGTFTDPGRQGSLDVTAAWHDLMWPFDGPDPLVWSPDGEVAVRGTLSDYHIELQGSLGGRGFQRMPLNLQARGDLKSLEYIDMKLCPPDGKAHVRGGFSWAEGLEWSLEAEGQGLNTEALGIDDLTVHAQGTASPLEISAADLRLDNFRAGSRGFESIQLSGKGCPASHVVEGRIESGPLSGTVTVNGGFREGGWDGSIHTEALGGTAAVEGSVTWSEGIVFSGTLVAAGLNPAEAWTSGLSMLNLSGSFTGSLVSGDRVFDLDLDGFDGRFAGRPFKGNAVASVSGDHAELLKFRMESGSGVFSASGKMEEELNLRWDLVVPDISELLTDVSGDLTGKGWITGPRNEPVLTAFLNSDEFQSAELAVSGLEVSAEIRREEEVVYTIEAGSGPFSIGKWEAAGSAVQMRGMGNRQRGSISVLEMAGMELNADIEGSLAREGWRGTLVAGLLDGEVNARIGLLWSDGLKVQVSGDATRLDPGVLYAPLPGNISLGFRISGELTEEEKKLELLVEDLQGVLREQTVKGLGRLEWSPETLSLHEFEVGLGDAAASASLSRSEDTLSGSWLLSVPDLGGILPDYSGTLLSSGEISGSHSAPVFNVSITASKMSGKGWSVGEARAEARVDWAGVGQNYLRVQGKDVLIVDNPINEVLLTGSGGPDSSEVSLQVKFPDSGMDIRGSGSWDSGLWSGSLKKAQWAAGDGETWILQEEAPVFLSHEDGVIGPVCLGSGNSRFCAGSQWKNNEVTGSLRLVDVPLSRLISLTGLPVNLVSRVSGVVEGGLKDSRLSGRVEMSSTPGSILYPTGLGSWAPFDFDGADLFATLDPEGLNSTFSVRTGGGKGDVIEGRLLLPGLILPSPVGSASDQAVDSSMKGRLTDLVVIQAFFPGLDKPEGIFSVDLRLGGTLGKPRIDGGFRLDEGDVLVTPLGLNLKEIKGSLTGSGQERADLTMGLISGQGRLDINGSLKMVEGSQPSGEIRITGDRLTAARIPQVFLVMSPDLKLEGDKDSLRITGSVMVPEAQLKPRELPEGGGVSPDVAIVDGEVGAPPRGEFLTRADVTVTLEDKVLFEGFGLTGRITGTLRIVEEPGKVTSGTGELNILEGQYRAYGQKLTVEKGRLIFSGGPLQNPGLDIRAVRRSEEVVAGILVHGTLMAPEISLFSDPPMDQADALSYLLLGKPLRRASGDEGQTLATAALSMGLTKGEALAQRIGGAFGLEEVSVQTESDVQQAALVVGRSLSPRVYVRYGVGLFQAFSIFQFGYRMSDKFFLQGESGANTGADLLYTIEK